MKTVAPTILAVALSLGFAATPTGAQTPEASSGPSQTSIPKWASEDPIANEGIVEDSAVDALKEMSTYLASLNTAAVTSQGSLDVVTNNGQRIQLDGVVNYKLRRPNGLVVDYKSDIKSRRFMYDGKTFTIYSPQLGFYSQVAAPPTNREVLDLIYDKFGIALPLEDLFRWADPDYASRVQQFQSAYEVGTATIDGVATDHYAFREEGVDWEVWIQQGDQPLPRKIVIVDRLDPAKPTFTARLMWNVNPTFSDSDFTFVPDANAKRIQSATYQGPGE